MSSETETEVKNGLEPKERKVVVSPEDALAAFEFWKHFDVPAMPGLKEAFDQFANAPTFENQEYLKLMVTKAISTTDHEAFKDEMFAKITEECGAVAYTMEFERNLEDELSKPEDAK